MGGKGDQTEASAGLDQESTEVRLLSRNLFLGADTSLVVGSFLNGASDLEDRAWEVLRQLRGNDFHDRAGPLVDEIQEAGPHVAAMQEVVLATHSSSGGSTTIDHLAILQDEIRRRELPYTFLPPQTTTGVDIRLAAGERIGFTDRIALLVHRDVEILGRSSGRYSAVQPTPGGITLERGWLAADCSIDGTVHRVVNTHLEVQTFPECQARQVDELLNTVLQDRTPSTFLMGDFNTNAEGAEGDPAWTPAHHVVTGAGFRDLWTDYREAEAAAGRPTGPGFTCCHDADLTQGDRVLDQRIDFVFHRGSAPKKVLDMHRIGIDPTKRSKELGLWPSDHAGLVARVAVSRAKP